jgi:hypothetical protein
MDKAKRVRKYIFKLRTRQCRCTQRNSNCVTEVIMRLNLFYGSAYCIMDRELTFGPFDQTMPAFPPNWTARISWSGWHNFWVRAKDPIEERRKKWNRIQLLQEKFFFRMSHNTNINTYTHMSTHPYKYTHTHYPYKHLQKTGSDLKIHEVG